MKVIKINTPDGQYTLPLIKVAERRASEYVNKKTHPKEWAVEVDHIMNVTSKGINWLILHTQYEDWEDETTKLNDDVKVSMEDFWSDSDDFEVVDI